MLHNQSAPGPGEERCLSGSFCWKRTGLSPQSHPPASGPPGSHFDNAPDPPLYGRPLSCTSECRRPGRRCLRWNPCPLPRRTPNPSPERNQPLLPHRIPGVWYCPWTLPPGSPLSGSIPARHPRAPLAMAPARQAPQKVTALPAPASVSP